MSAKLKNILKFASCFVLLLIAYFPTFIWMYDRWMAAESYYGHGFLIPIISLFIVWQRRSILKKSKIKSEFSGLWVVVICLVFHIACSSLKIAFMSGFSFVFCLYGLILFFFGREVTRNLTFPVFFLLAMIPLPLVVIGNLTVKLKLFAAQCATWILNHIGFPSIRDGSMIRMPGSHISVETPCSGLRSLISLLTLGLLLAYAMKAVFWKKVLLFLLSVPVAVATNVLRIIMLAVMNDLYGQKIAMGFFHDFSGFLVFGLAFFAMLAMSRTLENRY